jgi:hypothetical protein
MAKALLGYIGGADQRLVDELRRLRHRVSDLETEVVRLQVERDVLLASIRESRRGSSSTVESLAVPADLAGLTDVGAPALR